MMNVAEPILPDLQSYASFWDEPAPAAPIPNADRDAYAAFAVAADL